MPPKVTVVPHQGRTAIAVDGQVIPGMSYLSYFYSREKADEHVYQEMIDAGIRIFLCPWSFNRPNSACAWLESGDITFSMLDETLATLSKLSPDLWFVPRLYLDTPIWWAELHPEELVRYADDPNTAPKPFGPHGHLAQASMASKRWRTDIDEVLRRLLEHIEDGPYADRILGYCLNSGGTEEWIYWGAQQGRIGDYSQPATTAFRKWLKARYGNDKAFQQAWNTSETLATATVPSQRFRRDTAYLRIGSEHRPSVDFDTFLSDLTADTLLHFCHTVKQACKRPVLTGSFYGYLLWQTGLTNAVVANGHLALRKLLDSPDIDFITGITSYDNREPDGPGSFMLPVESVQAAGKLVFNEVDVRTHLTPGDRFDKFNASCKGPDVLNIWPLADAQESVAVYRREFAHHLIHGCAWWNFDMNGGWYSCPELREEFAIQSRIAQQALEWDMSSVAEIACVVSAQSPAYMRFSRMHDVNTKAWTDLQCDRATAEIYKAGVPVDWYMMDDLDRVDFRRYKVIYFYNPFYLTPEQIAHINLLKGDNRHLIFVGLPGAITDDAFSLEQASELVGMKLKMGNRRPGLIDGEYSHPIFRFARTSVTFGSDALLDTVLELNDPEARVFGTWHHNGKPAAAGKAFNDWLSYFFPVPINHAGIFYAIARYARCHVWTKKEAVLYVNRSLLALHTTTYPEPINLPEPMTITDLYSGKVLAKNTTLFTPPGEWGGVTGLYKLDREAP
jgi:hypothetical protein